MHRLTVGSILALAFLSGLCFGFEGRVTGPDGKPLAAARVAVVGRPGSVTSDAAGRFVLHPDPTPPFELIVSRPDGVALRPILVRELPASGPLELRLEPYLTQQVTVLSGATADLEVPPAAAFTLVGRADLDQRIPQHLSDVIENLPGAGRIEDGHSTVPSLRGLGRSRTLILLDDGRVTAERRAGPSATFLDPATVEEVEVVRGPGSVAYGSDAFGGVLRARTRIPSPGEEPELRYGFTGASNTGQESGGLELGGTVLGGGLMVGANGWKYGNYDSPEGEVPNSSARGWGFRGGYQKPLFGGNLRGVWRTDAGRDVGKPATDSNITRAYYPEESSHRLGLQFDRKGPGDWSRVSAAASWDQYDLVTNRDSRPTDTKPRQIAQADVFARDYGLRLEAERPLGGGRILLGVDGNGRYGLHAVNRTFLFDPAGEPAGVTPDETSIDYARRDVLGAFAGASGDLGRVALSSGLRIDRFKTKNEGGYFGDRSSSETQPSGFFGATIPFGSKLRLSAQIASGFREALLSDRYYRGISGRGFITGNPDLKPERSLQLDTALRYRRDDRLQVSVYGYVYRIDDLIERYAQVDPDDGHKDYFFRNRGEARFYGGEIEASARLAGGLSLIGSVQSLRGQVRDDRAPTDDVPPDGALVALRWDRGGAWWGLARFAAYLRDERPGPNEKTTPGYAVFDAGAGFRWRRGLEIQILGRNWLGQTYFGCADETATLAPGRTIALTVRGVL